MCGDWEVAKIRVFSSVCGRLAERNFGIYKVVYLINEASNIRVFGGVCEHGLWQARGWRLSDGREGIHQALRVIDPPPKGNASANLCECNLSYFRWGKHGCHQRRFLHPISCQSIVDICECNVLPFG